MLLSYHCLCLFSLMLPSRATRIIVNRNVVVGGIPLGRNRDCGPRGWGWGGWVLGAISPLGRNHVPSYLGEIVFPIVFPPCALCDRYTKHATASGTYNVCNSMRWHHETSYFVIFIRAPVCVIHKHTFIMHSAIR